jgi:hypothetical protein
VWVGSGLDRVALYYREDAPLLGSPASAEPLAGPLHDALRAALGRSAEFWPDLVAALASTRRGACPSCGSSSGRVR